MLIFLPLALPLTLPLAYLSAFFHPWGLAPPKHEKKEKDKANGNVNGNANGKKISTTYDQHVAVNFPEKNPPPLSVRKKRIALFRAAVAHGQVHFLTLFLNVGYIPYKICFVPYKSKNL